MTLSVRNLNDKEAEAVMWVAADLTDLADAVIDDPRHPVSVLRAMGFSDTEIKFAGVALEDIAASRAIPHAPFSTLLYAALQCTVENTSWITIYRTGGPTKDSPPHINEALTALRSLACKLEKRGIDINHIPFE